MAAVVDGKVLCPAHFLHHRSTTWVELTTYLQDLFKALEARAKGVGRALIEAVYAAAESGGINQVYWQTQHTNAAGRLLYE
jgi:GNAT superfamily N-acetyltransferase